jgi:hypothetical protein
MIVVAFIVLFHVPQAIAGVVVAASTEPTECDYQLRLWLWINSLRVLLVSFVMSALILFRHARPGCWNVTLNVARHMYQPTLFFSWAWIVGGVLGAVSSRSCEQEAPVLYETVFVLILVALSWHFIPLLLLAMVPCMLCCCPRSLAWLRVRRVVHIQRNPGLSATQLQALPSTLFAPSLLETGQTLSSQCAVCLADFEAGSEVRILPCKHAFCKACIDAWLTSHATCPSCRDPVTVITTPTHGPTAEP